MTEQKKLTGYPSIDKPWLKYYSEEAINIELPEKTLYQYIYDNNKDYKENIALNYFGKKITYGKLFENIEKAAKAFKAIGIKKGDIVTIMSMHTPETIYCVYALNRLGAVANMVYMTLSEQEILSTTKNTKSKALVVLSVALEKVEKIRSELNIDNIIVVSPSDSMKAVMRIGYNLKSKPNKLSEKYLSYKEFLKKGNNQIKVLDEPYDKNEPSVIVYTSGSTGEPKGVMLSNYNLNAVAHQYKMSGMEFQRGDTFFNMLPPFVGFGISVGMNLPLALGMEEVLWILPDKEKVVGGFIKNKPKHFVSGPAILDEFMEKVSGDISYLTTFAGGGESISIEKENLLNDFLDKHGANVKYVTGYGMTEFGATVCTGMNHVYKIGTLGITLPAVTVKIVDTETQEEVKYNEIGEICFNAPNTMLGYYKNDEATKDIIKIHKDGKKWLHTGDLGTVDEEGFIYFKGRIKRIYITKGLDDVVYKLFPARIEEEFLNNCNVRSCATIVVTDEERLNVAISFVTMKDKNYKKEKVIRELMTYAKEKFPEYLVPVKMIVLDEMPLTQSGKIDYKSLEKMVEEKINR